MPEQYVSGESGVGESGVGESESRRVGSRRVGESGVGESIPLWFPTHRLLDSRLMDSWTLDS